MKELSRNQKLRFTTYSSLVFQIVTIVSGFILPRFFLVFWGSEVNGLVASVSQFLSLISFLDMGVGQVVQAALYKPLSDKDYQKASEVLSSGRHFFKRLAVLFLVYTVVIAFLYPVFTSTTFGFWYVVGLTFILAINSFAQYYYGVNYQMLLNSDQRGYVQYFINTVTVLLNLGVSIVLLNAGLGLHAVKLSTAFIFLLRPLFMWVYIQKKYNGIRFNVKYSKDPIKQKWDGFAQHAASVVLTNTDVVVLTLFSDFANVSVYSVYNLVVTGMKQLFTSATVGVQAVYGELLAEKKTDELTSFFYRVEWTLHTATVIIFGATASLIVPFVTVYTNGITDAEYIQPLFGVLIVAAHAVHCLRLPYNMLVIAAGHFRQTQICHIVSAALNIVLSIILVWKCGLIGVAIGTLVAMTYQTIWLTFYISKNIVDYPIKHFWKQLFVDLGVVAASFLLSGNLSLSSVTYGSWIILAIEKTAIYILIALVANTVFYTQNVKAVFKIKSKRTKKEH